MTVEDPRSRETNITNRIRNVNTKCWSELIERTNVTFNYKYLSICSSSNRNEPWTSINIEFRKIRKIFFRLENICHSILCNSTLFLYKKKHLSFNLSTCHNSRQDSIKLKWRMRGRERDIQRGSEQLCATHWELFCFRWSWFKKNRSSKLRRAVFSSVIDSVFGWKNYCNFEWIPGAHKIDFKHQFQRISLSILLWQLTDDTNTQHFMSHTRWWMYKVFSSDFFVVIGSDFYLCKYLNLEIICVNCSVSSHTQQLQPQQQLQRQRQNVLLKWNKL